VPRENDPFKRKMTVHLRIIILMSKYHCDRASSRTSMGYAMPHDIVDRLLNLVPGYRYVVLVRSRMLHVGCDSHETP
jgi:hypothetical protein